MISSGVMNCAACGFAGVYPVTSVTFFWVCASTMYSQKFVGQFFVLAAGGDHQVINPARGVFFGDGLADGKIDLAKLIGHERPAHGRDHLVILEKVGQLSAGRPHLSDVGLQFQQLFLDGIELFVGEVVQLRGIGFVVAQNLRRHVDGRKIIPD